MITVLGGEYSFELSYRDGIYEQQDGTSVSAWCSEILYKGEPTDIVFMHESMSKSRFYADAFYRIFLGPIYYTRPVKISEIEGLIPVCFDCAEAVIQLVARNPQERIVFDLVSRCLADRAVHLQCLLWATKKPSSPEKLQLMVDSAKYSRQSAETAIRQVFGDFERVK